MTILFLYFFKLYNEYIHFNQRTSKLGKEKIQQSFLNKVDGKLVYVFSVYQEVSFFLPLFV